MSANSCPGYLRLASDSTCNHSNSSLHFSEGIAEKQEIWADFPSKESNLLN